MTYAKTRENKIAGALAKCATVKHAGDGRWEFELVNGKTLGVSARLVDDWLLMEAPLADRLARDAWWELLRLNAALQGISKFVVTRGSRSAHVRADVPLPGDEDPEGGCASEFDGALTNRVLEACAGLKAALRSFRGERASDPVISAPPETPQGRAEDGIEALRRLCGAAGWPFIERSSGKLMVDLDVRSGFYQAAVERRAEGAHLTVEVARAEGFRETSRQALGRLLLETGARVRLARPSIDERQDQIVLRFEVRFATMPTAVELSRAFASLSVACAMSGREARAIQDDAIARSYLAMIGGLAPEGQASLGAQASLPAPSGAGD